MSSLIQGIPIAFTENVFRFSNDVTWTLYAFVVISSSSPPTFVIVIETLFPSNHRFSAVSRRIKLICAPESNRMFQCLYKSSRPSMRVEITGSKAPDFSVIDAMFALTLISGFLWKRGWCYWLHCIPSSFSVHCFLRLQVDSLWSLPALFRQL